MANATEDYTRFRTIDPQNPPYEVEDKIGRKDPTYTTMTEDATTVSGVRLRTNYR